MSKITLAEANLIAAKYFKLLIDRHVDQGFSAQVVEKNVMKALQIIIWNSVMNKKEQKATKL